MFRNRTVKTKLLGGFLAVIAIFGVSVVFSAYYVGDIRTLSDVQDSRADDRNRVAELQNETGVLYSNQADVIINESGESVDGFRGHIARFRELIDEVAAAADTDEERRLAESLRTAGNGYTDNFDRVVDVYQGRSAMSADQLKAKYKELDDVTDGYKATIYAVLDQLNASYIFEYEEARTELLEHTDNTVYASVIASAAAAVLAVLLALAIGRLIGGPLVRLEASARRVADGDLTIVLEARKSKDEIGKLTDSFAGMVGSLKSLLRETDALASQVAASSAELNEGAGQSSEGLRNVSRAIEQVAAGAESQELSSADTARAVEEMAAGVQRIAESTSAIAGVSAEAAAKAREGDEAIRGLGEQMTAVRHSVDRQSAIVGRLELRSREIGEAVGAISAIARQTNLLALNAGIEAARAGEHGRGFAVVAGEVRKLAEQSAASAERIEEMLSSIGDEVREAVAAMDDGSREVQAGLERTRRTGQTFRDILGAAERVAGQSQEMSAVAEQMSASSQQVAASIEELSAIAKESAFAAQSVAASTARQLELSDRVASSSVKLNGLVRALKDASGRFRF